MLFSCKYFNSVIAPKLHMYRRCINITVKCTCRPDASRCSRQAAFHPCIPKEHRVPGTPLHVGCLRDLFVDHGPGTPLHVGCLVTHWRTMFKERRCTWDALLTHWRTMIQERRCARDSLVHHWTSAFHKRRCNWNSFRASENI